MYRQARYDEPLLKDMGAPGRVGITLPDLPVDEIASLVPPGLERDCDIGLTEVSEVDLIRHFTRLSQMSYGVDSGIYPLGSCTMKYNPRVCEEMAGHPKLNGVHPYQPIETVQGTLGMMYELQSMLAEVGGMAEVTLQPAAGAHGEYVGLLITRAYHHDQGEDDRDEIILPDTAHGTNPASAMMAGYKVVEIPSTEGCVDIEALKEAVSTKTAGFMLTNPNTLGIFEHDVVEIAEICHEKDALLYYDGANLNAIMGRCRPGDMGYDIMHFNLHKTFATPHGGGGPGSGPVGVVEELTKYLPVPVVSKNDSGYYMDYDRPSTVGKVHGFYGNVAMLCRAYTYMKVMGAEGLRNVADMATLNSNYMKEKLLQWYNMPGKRLRKHEFVLDGSSLKERGGTSRDAAKLLLDEGIHAPTMYFPLVVPEALMIEPTDTESKEEMDAFIERMRWIATEATEEDFHNSPSNSSISRVDEVFAARQLILSWRKMDECIE